MIFSEIKVIDGEQYVNIDLLIEEQKQNTELKDNWNKLKEWLEEENKNTIHIAYECDLDYVDVLDKMQEIEGGMNE